MVRIDEIHVRWFLEEDGSGDWCQAIATVSHPIDDSGSRRLDFLTSGGLHGIEGARDGYRREIERGRTGRLARAFDAFSTVPV